MLHTWSVDFVTGLPESAGYDSLLTVTDKFLKVVCILPGKESWSAWDWADQMWKSVIKDWGLPAAVVSDRDTKFTGDFWQQLMGCCKVQLWMTTANHPVANRQAEWTNTTVEIMLHCLLTGQYTSAWASVLPEVEQNLNCLPMDTAGSMPFEVLYGVPPWFMPEPPGEPSLDADTFISVHQQIQDAICDQYDLIQTHMALTFDCNHMPPTFGSSAFI